MADITAKLDELADIQTAAETTHADFENKRSQIVKSVQAELDALDAEYKPLIESTETRIAALETEIKDAVINQGESVKGGRISAIYAKGRVTWDQKELDRYADSHPEIMPYRKVGQPSVSLRALK